MFHTGLDGSCMSCHAGRWIATLNCSRSTVHWERLCIYNCARALNVEAERLNFSFDRPNVRIGERIVASDRMSSAWLNWHRNTAQSSHCPSPHCFRIADAKTAATHICFCIAVMRASPPPQDGMESRVADLFLECVNGAKKVRTSRTNGAQVQMSTRNEHAILSDMPQHIIHVSTEGPVLACQTRL